MSLPDLDSIMLTKTVLFVGDYFSMMTTVVLDESLRNEDEDDEDMAIRIAGVLLEEHYGWNVAEVSNEIGIVDEDEEE
jgi:hypothetical protein